MLKRISVLALLACFVISVPGMAQQKSRSLSNEDFPASQPANPVNNGPVKNGTSNNAGPVSGSNVSNSPINRAWLTGADGFEQAMKEHQNSGRPVVLYFYTDWCGFCKRFNSGFLASSEVEQYMKDLIRVKINPESGQNERTISDRYGVNGYPSFFIISTDSNRPKRVHPFLRRNDKAVTMTTAEFIQACRDAGGQ